MQAKRCHLFGNKQGEEEAEVEVWVEVEEEEEDGRGERGRRKRRKKKKKEEVGDRIVILKIKRWRKIMRMKSRKNEKENE